MNTKRQIYIQLPNFAVKTPFWLTFHWVSIFDQISSNTNPNRMGLVSLCFRKEILSYELKFFFWVLVEISSSVHGFVAVQPMFTKFDNLRNFEPYQDWKTSTSLTHMHTQAFRKISQLVNFKAIFLWPFTSPQTSN